MCGGGGSQHMHGCICQRSTKMRQSDAQAGSCPSDSSTHESPPAPASTLETYCRFQLPTANWCRCSALIPSVHRAPAPQPPPPATGGNLSIEHRNKCAFMASNSKVFKIFTFHALCLTQTERQSRVIFFAAQIPCKSCRETGCMC